MIDHVNLPVSDLAASRAFYDPLLALLGLKPLVVAADVVGYGIDHCVFGIIPTTGHVAPAHLAFKAVTPDQVYVFHDTALLLGAACNGAPGPRDAYGPAYFAAFVIDPDGHNIEAVLRG